MPPQLSSVVYIAPLNAIKALLAAIMRGDSADALHHRWEQIASLAASNGARALLLACTDLNAVPGWDKVSLPVIDATRALAAATVAHWLTL